MGYHISVVGDREFLRGNSRDKHAENITQTQMLSSDIDSWEKYSTIFHIVIVDLP